jgi:hypothetical protein
MKRVLLFGVLTAIAFASQPNGVPPSFTLAISAPQRIVAGERVVLEIKITNTADAPERFVFTHYGGVAQEYKYEIYDEKGKEVPSIEHPPTRRSDGSVLITPSRAPGSTMVGEIQSGKFILEDSVLSDRFRLDRPGTYTVRVSRAPSWSPRVYSNSITITVVEKSKVGQYQELK